ncbi:hypothetical protein FF38_01179 [Lucilia cuprina]|uniref:Uncharacterized protein n=1 Tax=Lucilia cuprina TaxID=7375 RepID=A0A0L0BXB3_LUCCU|nr:hypothetical protein FF38_01179 [Lucilia cuprina]
MLLAGWQNPKEKIFLYKTKTTFIDAMHQEILVFNLHTIKFECVIIMKAKKCIDTVGYSKQIVSNLRFLSRFFMISFHHFLNYNDEFIVITFVKTSLINFREQRTTNQPSNSYMSIRRTRMCNMPHKILQMCKTFKVSLYAEKSEYLKMYINYEMGFHRSYLQLNIVPTIIGIIAPERPEYKEQRPRIVNSATPILHLSLLEQ